MIDEMQATACTRMHWCTIGASSIIINVILWSSKLRCLANHEHDCHNPYESPYPYWII